MKDWPAEKLTVTVGSTRVSALLLCPHEARACYVLAHGAGAGMAHPFLEAIARSLADRQIATFRFQFPYMELGGKRPDPPRLAQATVRAAVVAARGRLPDLPLVAGGKSFGGRMTSQAQASEPLPGVRCLVFLGFPLHPANNPSSSRAEHLDQIQIPLLFLQGTRDALADIDLIHALIARLGSRAMLHAINDADHSFRLPARAGRTASEVTVELAGQIADWTHTLNKTRGAVGSEEG
jgi:predicted alpha/beta-hydrolase family hydrolase